LSNLSAARSRALAKLKKQEAASKKE
jgi:hypothetical protein